MTNEFTTQQLQRGLRNRGQAIHQAVNRWVTMKKRAPEGAWQHRREFATLLMVASNRLGDLNRDMSNWKTTASVVLRKYNDLVQGINAEPHADGCPAGVEVFKAQCTCWKKRVHEFENAKADA